MSSATFMFLQYCGLRPSTVIWIALWPVCRFMLVQLVCLLVLFQHVIYWINRLLWVAETRSRMGRSQHVPACRPHLSRFG